MQSLQKNCLIVFDDLVSSIKANEGNPLLTQLIFNRRHLLLCGTISVMIVSQKYTMIPARIRSNANWFILFKLNPLDLENVYKDVVMFDKAKWDSLVEYVYGSPEEITRERKYNNMGIWIEQDRFFLNFKPIEFGREQQQQ